MNDQEKRGSVSPNKSGELSRCLTNFVLFAAVLFMSITAGTRPIKAQPQAQNCRAPLGGDIDKVRLYVAKRLQRNISDITLNYDGTSQSLMCFTRLTVTDRASRNTFVLFLSPDGSAVTSELYDLSKDPEEDQRNEERNTARLLRDGAGAINGARNGPVELVIFVDFECPFCKRLDRIVQKVLLDDTSKEVRYIYRAYPLTSHPWAYEAATLAACVQTQSNSAFWDLYSDFFQHQSEITVQNLSPMVDGWMKDEPTVDVARIHGCIQGKQGKSIVDHDMELGLELGVNATPTVYLNGAHLEGIDSESTLRGFIANSRLMDADKSSASPSIQREPSRH